MSVSSLVLGGSGFVGSHLCEALLEAGHHVKVVVPRGFGLEKLEGILKEIEVVRLDLAGAGQTNAIWRDIDRVFHLACTTRPKTANDNPVRDLEENLIATVRILDRCAANRVGRVIFMSSGGTVYGKTKRLPIKEDDLLEPICSYGIHKLAIEKYLRFFKAHRGLDYRIARVSNAYGERQSLHGNQGLVGTVLEKMLKGQVVEVYGKGEMVRDYIYVSDIVSALMLLAEREAQSYVFNVGSGQGLRVIEMIRLIEKVVGYKAKLDFLPARLLDVEKNVLDISRIRKELGWKPRVVIREGIARTAAWWSAEMESSSHCTMSERNG